MIVRPACFRRIAIALGLSTSLLIVPPAAHAEGAVLLEEVFSNPGKWVNQNVNSLGWEGYAGDTAVNVGGLEGDLLNGSLLISTGKGNPGDLNGYLAAITFGAVGYPSYAIVKTDLALKDPGTFTWRMQGAKGSEIEVRVLVQAGGKWFASRESFTARATGLADEFPHAAIADVEQRFEFSTDAKKWMEFTLNADSAMALGDAVKSNLPSSEVTGIGFFITCPTKSDLLRIDTLRIEAK